LFEVDHAAGNPLAAAVPSITCAHGLPGTKRPALTATTVPSSNCCVGVTVSLAAHRRDRGNRRRVPPAQPGHSL